MSEYDKKIIGRQAAELGFPRDAFEKVYRLVELLSFFESDPILSKYLALKGGTCINLTIFRLPRLSVDIDLDFAENLPLSEMEGIRGTINNVLEQYMDANGYGRSVTKSKSYHALDSLVYYYTNTGRVRDNIKIEINYALRSHLLPLQKRPIETLDVFSPVNILALDPVEVFATKISALLTRAAARDLYDLNSMIHTGLFDETQLDMLRKCAVFYLSVGGGTGPVLIDLGKINAITSYKIKTDLYPVISSHERFNLAEVKTRVIDFLVDLLTLTADEREYLSAFDKKEYRPELLFDETVLDRIADHPMAKWKMRNT